MKFKIDGAARTHTGRVRSNNEDNFYLLGRYREDVEKGEDEAVCRAADRRFLAAVADGMGGEEQGERASLIAVQKRRVEENHTILVRNFCCKFCHWCCNGHYYGV